MALKTNNYGQGADGLGGWFDNNGMSNSQDYLKNIANISRDQTQGNPLSGMSDKAIDSMIGFNKGFANSTYIDPLSGRISSVKEGNNWLNVGDVRQVYARLTGQQANMQTGVSSTPAPFVNYRDFGDRTNLGAIQQGLIGGLNSGGANVNERYYGGFGGIGSMIPGMYTGGGTSKATTPVVDPLEEQRKKDLEVERYKNQQYGR